MKWARPQPLARGLPVRFNECKYARSVNYMYTCFHLYLLNPSCSTCSEQTATFLWIYVMWPCFLWAIGQFIEKLPKWTPTVKNTSHSVQPAVWAMLNGELWKLALFSSYYLATWTTDLLNVSSTVVLTDHPSDPLAEVELQHGDHATEAFGQRLAVLQQNSCVCEDAPGPLGRRGFHRVAIFSFIRRCSGVFQIVWDKVFFGSKDKNFGILLRSLDNAFSSKAVSDIKQSDHRRWFGRCDGGMGVQKPGGEHRRSSTGERFQKLFCGLQLRVEPGIWPRQVVQNHVLHPKFHPSSSSLHPSLWRHFSWTENIGSHTRK